MRIFPNHAFVDTALAQPLLSISVRMTLQHLETRKTKFLKRPTPIVLEHPYSTQALSPLTKQPGVTPIRCSLTLCSWSMALTHRSKSRSSAICVDCLQDTFNYWATPLGNRPPLMGSNRARRAIRIQATHLRRYTKAVVGHNLGHPSLVPNANRKRAMVKMARKMEKVRDFCPRRKSSMPFETRVACDLAARSESATPIASTCVITTAAQ